MNLLTLFQCKRVVIKSQPSVKSSLVAEREGEEGRATGSSSRGYIICAGEKPSNKTIYPRNLSQVRSPSFNNNAELNPKDVLALATM